MKLPRGTISLDIKHVYREANNVVDWVAFFVAEHLDEVFSTDLGNASIPFRDILFYDLVGCIYTRLVLILHFIKKWGGIK